MSQTNPASQEIPRILPRGPHALGGDVVKASQRLRILEAMTAVCAEKGYAASTVADVVARSGVSRKTFYEHFENLEKCFIAAYDHGMEALNARIAASVAGQEPAVEGATLRSGLSAYIDALAEMPDFARVFALEALAGGPAMRRRRDEGFEQFVDLYRVLYERAREQNNELPPTDENVLVAALGAVAELIRRTISTDGPEGLPAIKETAIDVTWTLLSGVEHAPD